MGSVALVKTDVGIENALSEALRLIGGLENFLSHNDCVMLKPNLNDAESFTNAVITETLIRKILDFGVRKLFIGEATFGGAQMTDMYFRKTGYLEMAQKYGVDIHNLNKSDAVKIPVKNPLLLENAAVAREALDADKIINLPNMKVHYATQISLALKNMKGVLVGDEKRRFHETGLEKAIADLNNAIPADLNIVDAVTCMERMGPRGGDLLNMNLIMAGKNAWEIDAAGAQVMGFPPSEIKHLKYYMENNGLDLKILGNTIEHVARPFKRVDLAGLAPENFSIHNRDACSACMNAFLLSCRVLEKLPEEQAEIFMGSSLPEEKNSENLKIAFGNCCQAELECDIRIKGCPPFPFALGEKMKIET